MRFTRWLNPNLPQMLQIAVFLLYFDAVFGVLRGSIFNVPLGTLIVVGAALGGLGVANELKWGYKLAVAVSALGLLPFLLIAAYDGVGEILDPTVLLAAVFPVAQFALLVHPQSRSYQKIWFT